MAQMPLTIDYRSNLLPAPNGLLAASVGPLEMPAHATFAGLEFSSDLCAEGHLYPGVCDTTPPSKEFPDCEEPGGCSVVTGLPFWTYVSEVCGGGVGRSFAEAERRVRRGIQLRQNWLVERAFWGDDPGVPGYLQQLGITPIGNFADPVHALSVLEQDAADNFGLPVTIHARAGMATILGAAGALRTTSGPFTTWKGNRIVFGDGYGAIDDAGDPFVGTATEMWATGPVTIWGGNTEVPPVREVFDRVANQQYALAEVPWIIAHECYAAAVMTTTTVEP
jgi:hypothetical protein